MFYLYANEMNETEIEVKRMARGKLEAWFLPICQNQIQGLFKDHTKDIEEKNWIKSNGHFYKDI